MEYDEVKFIENDEIKRIDINQIEPMELPQIFKVNFENQLMPYALYRATHVPDDFKSKIIALSPDADWVIRRFEDEIYLIALKIED